MTPEDFLDSLRTVITVDDAGVTRYKLDGVWHRVGGPAIDCPTSNKFWYKYWYYHGLRHRMDGPAVEYECEKNNRWYIFDKQYSKEVYDRKVKNMIRNGCNSSNSTV